jgi:transposase-like protein
MRGEVVVGPERRRRWSEDEKVRIIEESRRPGAQVTDIARRHGISRALLYSWRRAARCASVSPVVPPARKFVPVLLSAPEEPQNDAAVTVTAVPDRGSRRPAKRGTDGGGEHWAILASLIETCKLNDINPQAYLADILARIANDYPINRIDELLPWTWTANC